MGTERVAPRLYARAQARRRAGGLVLIALMVALAGGVTLASVAGARRTASVVTRLRDVDAVRFLAIGILAFGAAAAAAVAVAAPGVFVLANLVAGVPARMARRVRPAVVLRRD